jgi:hypothetical protein
MATARGNRDLERWALLVRWSRDRGGWRALERLALRETDGTWEDPRQILGQLGLVTKAAR